MNNLPKFLTITFQGALQGGQRCLNIAHLYKVEVVLTSSSLQLTFCFGVSGPVEGKELHLCTLSPLPSLCSISPTNDSGEQLIEHR